jgi:hypothetical protein
LVLSSTLHRTAPARQLLVNVQQNVQQPDARHLLNLLDTISQRGALRS